MSERIEVRAATPLVNTSSATVGKVIENRRVTELPLNGRNALALMALVPSVKSNSGPTQSGFSDRGVALSAISINGGPGGINQYILDGATNNQSYLADINVNPAVDAVEEFKVQTSTMSSEFGFTAGGVVNIVTKSGTNQFKGSLYDFVRNGRFDAKNAFATDKPQFEYNQGGGAIGGPIKLPGSMTAPTARSSSSTSKAGTSRASSRRPRRCRPMRCGAATSRTCATPAGG